MGRDACQAPTGLIPKRYCTLNRQNGATIIAVEGGRRRRFLSATSNEPFLCPRHRGNGTDYCRLCAAAWGKPPKVFAGH